MSTPRPKNHVPVPIIGSSVLQVCPRGHIERVPAPGVGLVINKADGQVFYPLCPVCQSEFFVNSFPSRVMPVGATEEAAKVEVLRWQQEIEGMIVEANAKPAEPS